MHRRVLLTGGAGFIGHHVASYLLDNTDYHITFLDRLDTSGNLNRIAQIDKWAFYKSTRCKFVFHDLKAPINDVLARQLGYIDIILHLAASTHVDRSIVEPLLFVQDNVMGTAHLLEYARHHPCDKFVYFSTDEVFGPANKDQYFKEWDRYKSSNPYAATKAAGEELALAYHNTYGVPVRIVHTMNVFGERQHPEKYIPLVVDNVLRGGEIKIHADKHGAPGSRFYVHARNVAAAVNFVLKKGTDGEKYNIVGEREVDNLTLATRIAEIIGKPLHCKLVDYHAARPGHDLRYALDGSLMRSMGFKYPNTFDQSLVNTVTWTVSNKEWSTAA